MADLPYNSNLRTKINSQIPQSSQSQGRSSTLVILQDPDNSHFAAPICPTRQPNDMRQNRMKFGQI